MFDPESPLTRDDVLQGYRLVLGRSAESDEIVDDQQRNLKTLQNWRDALFNSEEFAERHVKPATIQPMDQVFYGSPPRVDHQVSPEAFRPCWIACVTSGHDWARTTSTRSQADPA